MIHMLAYDENSSELDVICETVRKHAALKTDDVWKLYECTAKSQCKKLTESKIPLDAICYDITGEGAISGVEELRSSYDKAYLIMVADISISPVKYMKPTIMASSLLLRPLSTDAVSDVIGEMIDRLAVEDGLGDVFVVNDENGRNRLLYKDILYFEAREKKIFACTDYAEYAFYETLENLGARLPDCFKRCHRSYIVNTDYITRIVFKEMSVYLGDSYIIPVSRSYRETMREYKYGKL